VSSHTKTRVGHTKTRVGGRTLTGALASGSAAAASQRVPRVHPATTPVPPPVRGNTHQQGARRRGHHKATGVAAGGCALRHRCHRADHVGRGHRVSRSYAGGGPVVLFKGDAA